MFFTKETALGKELNRNYLTIMDGFKPIFVKEIKHLANADNVDVFKEMAGYKYDTLHPDKFKGNHARCVERVQSYGLTDPIGRIIDKCISRSVQNETELSTLLEGVTTSLRLKGNAQKLVIEHFRKYPTVLFARLMEMKD